MKKENLAQWDLLQAKCYEAEMKKFNNGLAAASWCKDAIKYYKKAKNKKKVNELSKKYDKLCANMQLMTTTSPPIDLSDEITKNEEFINKSEQTDVVKKLICDFMPQYEGNKNDAESILAQSGLTRTFSTTLLDEYGHAIGYVDSDEEHFRSELYRMYDISFHINSKLLFCYIQHALETNKLSTAIILEHFKMTWFGVTISKPLQGERALKYRWLQHIQEPIISYFNKLQNYLGNNSCDLILINEIDSLTLKVEGILRDLIELSQTEGFSVSKLENDSKERQIFKWKTINELLFDENIFKVLPKNDVWFMRYFLIDYFNLRNRVAHCLIFSSEQYQYSLYSIQGLLIILLRLSCVKISKNNSSRG